MIPEVSSFGLPIDTRALVPATWKLDLMREYLVLGVVYVSFFSCSPGVSDGAPDSEVSLPTASSKNVCVQFIDDQNPKVILRADGTLLTGEAGPEIRVLDGGGETVRHLRDLRRGLEEVPGAELVWPVRPLEIRADTATPFSTMAALVVAAQRSGYRRIRFYVHDSVTNGAAFIELGIPPFLIGHPTSPPDPLFTVHPSNGSGGTRIVKTRWRLRDGADPSKPIGAYTKIEHEFSNLSDASVALWKLRNEGAWAIWIDAAAGMQWGMVVPLLEIALNHHRTVRFKAMHQDPELKWSR